MRQARDSPTTLVVVVEDGTEVVVGRVDPERTDLALVDVLLRLHLAARRCGWRLRIDDPAPCLCGLLELTGLGGVLAVKPRGQPELGEQLGVEEVVQPGDPPA
ncbi:MAG: sle [Conexibacter sp.]|nr:sle [Conexibacter sp.]